MGFLEDVDAGLSADRKAISSRYFYDANGDKIFQAIMHMPEYYLTDVEHEIFSTRAKDILKALDMGDEVFDLVEFGAGDGLKTKILIERMTEAKARFRYVPIDISGDVLQTLKSDMEARFPQLEVAPENKEYFAAMEHINLLSKRPKLILFIGSSIGNFLEDRTRIFLNTLWEKMNPGDKVLIGFDLQKNPHTILKAYNDPHGITKAFNLNVLTRINNELKGNFDLDGFDHYPVYDPDSGLAKSYLVSLKKQSVYIQALDKTFHFEMGETIHTEISRKYTVAQIEDLFGTAKFKICEHFFDCKHYYVDTLAEKPSA
jgi:dimethylhistidine N-methyltransferase